MRLVVSLALLLALAGCSDPAESPDGMPSTTTTSTQSAVSTQTETRKPEPSEAFNQTFPVAAVGAGPPAAQTASFGSVEGWESLQVRVDVRTPGPCYALAFYLESDGTSASPHLAITDPDGNITEVELPAAGGCTDLSPAQLTDPEPLELAAKPGNWNLALVAHGYNVEINVAVNGA